jgi:hypothetical protein
VSSRSGEETNVTRDVARLAVLLSNCVLTGAQPSRLRRFEKGKRGRLRSSRTLLPKDVACSN